MTDHTDDDAVRRRRLAWRCAHRGMKEVDLIFGGFVADNIDRFTPDELAEVERLSDIPDGELLDWFIGRSPVPDAYDTPLVRRMMEKRLTLADYNRDGRI